MFFLPGRSLPHLHHFPSLIYTEARQDQAQQFCHPGHVGPPAGLGDQPQETLHPGGVEFPRPGNEDSARGKRR
ncbi:ribosomal protein S2 [Moorella thermoacetica Y72]|uniref:Ribosomal protein S2 n=1 Tax=Moorella thermoacetica Y72 TaxID=1325331 RepID=A0A0S6UG04_NEOTH|nr:ribosomal protein S2 [Moorella thermoacetica Y72]